MDLMSLLVENPTLSCIIIKDHEIIFTSEEKGVKPMMDFYEQYGDSMRPLTVIDRVMGKGAVLLSILIGAEHIITPIISDIALSYGEANGLKVQYEKTVPYIINRSRSGRCPIETAVLDIIDVDLGYCVIKDRLLELREESHAI